MHTGHLCIFIGVIVIIVSICIAPFLLCRFPFCSFPFDVFEPRIDGYGLREPGNHSFDVFSVMPVCLVHFSCGLFRHSEDHRVSGYKFLHFHRCLPFPFLLLSFAFLLFACLRCLPCFVCLFPCEVEDQRTIVSSYRLNHYHYRVMY